MRCYKKKDSKKEKVQKSGSETGLTHRNTGSDAIEVQVNAHPRENSIPSMTSREFNNAINDLGDVNEIKQIRSLTFPGVRKKREPASCITWKEIDEFNKENINRRDLEKVKIDSEKFLEVLRDELLRDDRKFDNYLSLVKGAEIVGEYKDINKINELLNREQRVIKHVNKVGRFSGIVSYSMLVKDLTSGLLHDDYKGVLISVGMIAGTHVFAELGQVVSNSGAKYIAKGGSLILGKSLKASAPFLGSVSSLFNVYSLVKNIEKYNQGDDEALVYVVLDGVSLAVDVGVIGIEVAGALGMIGGTSSLAGPIGMAVGTSIAIGTQVYVAVSAVKKIDNKVRLTGNEKLREGLRAFFGRGTSPHANSLLEAKEMNNQLVRNATDFLKQHKNIQRYVFSSVQTIKHVNYVKCATHEAIGDYLLGIRLLGMLSHSNICDYVLDDNGSYRFWKVGDNIGVQRYKAVDQYNQIVAIESGVNLRTEIDVELSRVGPDQPSKGRVVCSPYGRDILGKQGYYCLNAIGVEYTEDRTANETLIELGNGRNVAFGSVDQDNIFIIGEGEHTFFGGDKNDHFIFQECKKIKVTIDGSGGINTVDVGRLSQQSEIFANLRYDYGIISDGVSSTVDIVAHNISKILGRKNKVDEVVADCNIKYIDGRGMDRTASDLFYSYDIVTVLAREFCSYDMDIIVNPSTIVKNNAAHGNFRYLVINENKAKSYIELDPDSQTNNKVIISNKLFDISNINRTNDTIQFDFIEGEYEGLSGKSSLIVTGISRGNVKYFLENEAEIVVEEQMLYTLQRSDRPIDFTSIKDYVDVAKRLKMRIFTQSEINNEAIVVGSGNGYDVLQNIHDSKTHIVSNSAETVFVISCSPEKLTYRNLPLPEVLIYNFADNNEVYTLDLSQIREKTLTTQKIDTEINIMDKDLLIQVFLVDQSKQSVLKVTLKDAWAGNWYERLHIITDVVLMNIRKVKDEFKLIPLPLVLDVMDNDTVVINSEDLEKGNEIEVNRLIGDYIFARNNDNLLVTNIFNSNLDIDGMFNIIFKNAYLESNLDKIKTLRIKFNGREGISSAQARRFEILRTLLGKKEIIFSEEADKIDKAENIKHLQKKFKVREYRSILDISQGHLDLELFKAIRHQEFYRLENLIRQGANVNIRDSYNSGPIHYAAKENYKDVIKLLLNNGVDVDSTGNCGFYHGDFLSFLGQCESISYRFRRTIYGYGTDGRYNMHRCGHTPLMCAAFYGHIDTVIYLLEKGANINARDNSGRMPINWAAKGNHKNIIELFLNKGIDMNVADQDGNTLLHWACKQGNLEIVKFLIDKGADVNVKNNLGKIPLDIAKEKLREHSKNKECSDVVQCLEKLNRERGGAMQRTRRHARHHMSRKLLAIDSSNQPEVAVSSGTRPPSWINDLFSWVKSSIGGLLSSKPVGISSTKDSISQVDGQFAKASISNSSLTGTTLPSDDTDKRQENGGFFRDNVDYVNANLKRMCERHAPVKFKPKGRNTILEMGDHYLSQVDFNGTITLFDLLIRRFTGQKYISTVDQSISPLEAQGHALDITKGFEKVVEQAGLKSGVSMHRLNIDYMGMQKDIVRKVVRGQFNEISEVLSSYLEKACPSREAGCPGKLSSKKFDKFIAQFNNGLLNQSIEHNRDGRLEVDGAKQMNLEPQSYLSNASVYSHSEVSNCLSEIGVTKLGGNLNR